MKILTAYASSTGLQKRLPVVFSKSVRFMMRVFNQLYKLEDDSR